MTIAPGLRLRTLSVFSAFAVLVTLVAYVPLVGAVSRNEVLINVLYDGTPDFDAGEPTAPAGAAPEAHTPGLDGGPQNLVVRTWDQFAVRVDWNVNEDEASNVALTVVLPPYAIWSPDDSGTFGGCDPATSTFPNPQTLVCELGDQLEGSNGVIRPVATLLEPLDGEVFDVTSTLTTSDDPTGVADGLDQGLTVSERPNTDWTKHSPDRSALLNVGGVEGYVVRYPLTLSDFSQAPGDKPKGTGPIDDSAPLTFFDHAWSLTPSVTLATPAQMTAAGFGGPACGDYVDAGAFPSTTETWACAAPTTGAGYPVYQVTVTGHTTRPVPATNADGSPNDQLNVVAGQIAFWLTKAEVDAAIANPNNANATNAALFNNAISHVGDSSPVSADPSDPTAATGVVEPEVQGTNSASGAGPVENNVATVSFGASPPTPPGGGTTGHDVRWLPGPMQIQENTFYGFPARKFDSNNPGVGGLGNLPGVEFNSHSTNGTDHIGEVSRGQTLTIEASFQGTAKEFGTADYMSGCVAFDTAHYQLKALPTQIPVRHFNDNNFTPQTPTAYSTTAPSAGPLVHIESGDADTIGRWRPWFGAVIDNGMTHEIEFSNSPLPTYNVAGQTGINDDGLTCDPADAGPAGWVSSTDTATLAAQFDPNGDGLYEGITRARVRTTTPADFRSGVFESLIAKPNDAPGNRTFAFFQAQVLQDKPVNSDGQELFAFMSHTYSPTLWDGTTPADLSPRGNNCRPHEPGAWRADGGTGDEFTTTNWCANRFHDTGADSFDTSDGVNFEDHSIGYDGCCNRIMHASGAVVQIVGAKLNFDKTNLDGPGAVKDNGQLVQFSLEPSVTGATIEALGNVTVTDNLPVNYEFVRFVTLPTTPGSTCTEAGNSITCRYSEPDPAIDSDPLLPQALPGGWPTAADGSSEVVIEVRVVDAIANPTNPTVITNVANANSSFLVPWDDSAGEPSGPAVALAGSTQGLAQSFMPLPADEGAIIKAVDTLEGPCEAHPTSDPIPAGWADRCSMIGYNDNMSFTLSLTNEGNTAFTDIRFVDVFPYNGDTTEAPSNTPTQNGSTPTIGDGRTPPSDYAGTLGYVSYTAADTVWVSGDASPTVSRDPDNALANTVWCDAPGGVQVAGPAGGTCPATGTDVTATYTTTAGPLNPGQTMTHQLTLDAQDHECDDIWTNAFGARVDQIFLPIRSNDVSIMVDCSYDLALEKTIDPAFAPGADWITAGTTTVDFLMEVTNQGDPVEDFDITDYVDTAVFEFDPANNPAGTTAPGSTGGPALPFTWDIATNGLAAPVALVDGPLGVGESVLIPVTLTILDPAGTLENWAEISRFDSDGDPSNGDSDPANPNNPTTGPLADDDSSPDGTQANDAQPTGAGAPGDGETAGDGSGADPVTGDEDDHDVAGIPIYDLELIKTLATPAFDFGVTPPTASYELTVTNQGNADVFFVDVTDYGAPGLTYSPTATAAAWSAASLTGVVDAAPTFTINGPLAPGASITIPVVYEMDLTQAPFTNAAEISAFDDDSDPANPANPIAVDIDSTPDGVNDDDVIDHDVQNYDPNGDGYLNEETPGDEDDHDIEVAAPYDLALRKQIDPTDPDLADGIQNGDEITFFIEVFNQLSPVQDFDVTDYISSGWVFDPTANPAGSTTPGSLGGPALPYTWASTSPTTSVASVVGPLGNGESVIIPIVLTVDISGPVEELSNLAEISRFDNDGDPTNGDSDPANPDSPTSGPLVDIDSTPDGDELNDSLTDEIIDGSSGDEDDHDIASTKWWDLALIKERSPGQAYLLDPAANPLQVSYDITVKNQGPEDAVNVSVVDSPPAGLIFDSFVDASGTVTSPAANQWSISALAAGDSVTFSVIYTVDLATVEVPSVNFAEISGLEGDWDPDGPNGPLPSGIYPVSDIDSTPDSDPTNDAIPNNGTVDPADSHNDIDNDSDGDGNLHNADGIDEDDHDSEAFIIPFDLALMKTFVSMDSPLLPDGTVTMLITIENQGPGVEQIDITDYLDPAMWIGFDPALNSAGAVDASSTAAAAFSFVWDETDAANPVVTITSDTVGDKFLFGETLAVPITVQIAPTFDTSMPLVNIAEISNFDSDQDPTNGDAADGTLTDIDSTPDGTNESGPGETIGGDLVDDSLAGDGQPGNDEDDHDPVIIPVMDLALRKTVDPSTSFPIAVGQPVTFLIEVINQGSVHVTNPSMIDYVDTTMWEPFDAALNAAGTTGGDAALAYAWTANGTDGDIALTGTLAPAETVTVPVTLIIAAGADLEGLSNTAEITGGTASDENGTTITNPDGSPITDIDSTPDATNDDPLSDDVVDGTDGDEDDHDIALVQAPTYNLGNQVWIDSDDNGMIDPGEEPVPGVVVELFTDNDGDGLPDDTNGDGIIDSADAIGSTTTGPDGEYLFTDLPPGDYIVGIGPSNFDPGGPLFGTVPSSPVSDANTDIDDDNNGAAGPYDYVWSTPVTLDDAEPTGESGFNNDPNHPDSLSNQTVDFGFNNPVFDLALEKRLADGQSGTISVGDDVTFTIEIINQGDVTGTDMEIIDYLPPTMTLNDADWTGTSDGNATIVIEGPLAAGATTTVDITVTVNAVGDMNNTAEITSATPVDEFGAVFLMPNGEPFPDIDSVFDANDDDELKDGVTNENGRSGGDEDDHDIATIVVQGRPLAFTGGETGTVVLLAMLLIAVGWAMVNSPTRRRDDEVAVD